ncbi:hypothetical protein [Paractinoplanes hotanensis]|uniref:Uncharacterized protein n=1 Tax=Paractinoplanes hotanensis TaxID=2906497 RepID=A0ABT0Y5I4_9ACTN|nr:hypothetical protein [Actinoplanes hotanensis]MCM4081299.1 hypothetical protein [Actinoplanes hotanensis]
MRSLNALLRALRTRRNKHGGYGTIADSGPPGLADLLEAARAPATPEELAGEKEVVAAFVAHRRRAARSSRRHRTKARIRAVLVPVTAGLALLVLAATGVAARTGNLPQEAQQRAHRLFSALGVPAPRTGNPVTPSPTPARPGPRPSLDVTALTWCQAWSGPPVLSREDRRKLSAAAGGEDGIDEYCRDLHRSASAQPPDAPSPAPPSAAPPSVEPPSAEPQPSGVPATPGPAATGEPGRPTQPGRAPTAPPSRKPPKPTHTGKPTGAPGAGRGARPNAAKQTTSPSVATTPAAEAQSDPHE